MKSRKLLYGILILLLLITTVSQISCSTNKIDIEEYTVIYAANDGDTALKAALDISELTNTELVKDISSEIAEKEILIGNTNRTESIAVASDLLDRDYSIKCVNDKIVICGGSDKATAEAVSYFIANFITEDGVKVTDYTYKHEYSIKSMTVSGNNITNFNVISTATDGSYDSFTESFAKKFTDRTGYKQNEHADALNIMIKCDSSLAPNEYLIKVATGDITLSGANTYGIEKAISYFFDELLVSEKVVFSDGDAFDGTIDEATFKYYNYINERTPLSNTYCKLTNDKKLNIVYYGGSVTSGHGSSDSETKSWRAKTEEWFDETFPDAEINHYNSAIGGSGSMLGAFRCAHDVLALDPDLVFIEFAINDVYCGTSVDDIKTYYESIIRQIKEKSPDCDIVALYITDQSNARNGNNSLYLQALSQEAVAEHYKLPSIYLGGALCSTFDYMSDEKWSEYFIDIVHPTDLGYSVYFDILREFLESELIYADAYANEITTEALPEKLTDIEFTPRMIFVNELEIIENENWEISESSYWNTANSYNGYIYPTSADNTLTLKFTGQNAALFAEYGSKNRLVYSFDGGNDRIQNQQGNHPLLLNYSLDEDTNEHTLTLSVNIKDEDSPYIISALLLW